jgi:DNA-binding transcriptional regulator LsrR (DeoR family)
MKGEDGYSADATQSRIARKYQLTEQDAKEYVEKYLLK